jgi:hypothetical protein
MKTIKLILIACSIAVYGYSQDGKKYRSAKTGQYIPKENATKHPSKTVSEKIKGKK